MKTPSAPLRLRRSESPGAGLRRIARGQLAAAIRVLEGKGDPHLAVHEARKAIKKFRALLRLAEPVWEPGRRATETAPLREAARQLAPLRDARVRLQTFDTLLREAGLTPAEFSGTRAALEAAARRLARGAAARRRKAAALLRGAHAKIARWRLGGLDRETLVRELRRSYRKGREALEAYRETPNAGTLHAWRKRIKTLFYHLRIVHPSKRAMQAVEALDALGEQAGNVHDLTVLREALAAAPKGVQSALLIGEIESLLPLSTRAVLARGGAFFRESPRKFLEGLE